ncbi:oligopeptidase A [Pseudomonas prosekii]|uniref:Oligopeptidase A n=1 Tax=Pseudomonas prosekii TaxID=1148509 RepID=A0A3L8CNL6_9PSED|nr:M3 family metallopeptidase [Pseudomonas prosekii]RLU09862.1 oligopeptidase A [Pseudomonas prosekii]RLU12151.1 oligopeptidase A [Pseudomonas prosekii]
MPDINPLLQRWDLPPWSSIRAEHLIPAVEQIMAENRQVIADVITTQSAVPTWDDLVLAVAETDARLDEVMAIIATLDTVQHDGDAWRRASAVCAELQNRYLADKSSNLALYRAYQTLAQSAIALNFDAPRKAVLEKILRGFRLSGIELSAEQRGNLAKLNHDIGLLQSLFLHNLDNANAAWSKRIADAEHLKGLNQATQDRLAENARQAGHSGWLLPLDRDTCHQVLTYAENRALREEYFAAYFTRASDQGPHAGQFDNEPVLALLLAQRHRKALLLGYENFAQLSLANRMADSTEHVSAFLRQQVALETPRFEADARAIAPLAAELGLADVQAWDHLFLAEKLRQRNLGTALKNLRSYFPFDGTLRRLCLFSERMFGIQIVEQNLFERWHDEVRLFEVSEHGQVIGHIYLDPYHRQPAPDFAWTATPRNRRVDAEGRQTLPIAILHANFAPVAEGQPGVLNHLDLRVLFHEFGHCLHQVLTRSPHYNLSGVSEFGRDTAEFAGQFFELWCQSPAFLQWLAAHHQSGEGLSEARIKAALAAIKQHSSWETAYLLLSASFDFELHCCQGDGRSPQQVFEDVQQTLAHLKMPAYARFANGFDYLATGYEASVYAYKWSGVLASEAFKRFDKHWVFNAQTGRAFREAVFAPGDARSLMVSLEEFLGRPLAGDLFSTDVTSPVV